MMVAFDNILDDHILINHKCSHKHLIQSERNKQFRIKLANNYTKHYSN